MNYNLQRYVKRDLESEVRHSLESFPVTALIGPRQCGKSTLAHKIVSELNGTTYLDLEKPSDLRKLDDPEFFFHSQKQQLICIDEVQIGPELFPIIRVMVDEDRRPGKFFILGSATQDLIRNSSETLAGRIHYIELGPLSYNELVLDDPYQFANPQLLWTRGGFPESILAQSETI